MYGNTFFMSYSSATDTAERQCQRIHFNLQASVYKCSKPLLPICEHNMHRLSTDCLARVKMPDVCRIASHAAWL